MPEALCELAHPDLDGPVCLDEMARLQSFGIQTLADVLALTRRARDCCPGLAEAGREARWARGRR